MQYSGTAWIPIISLGTMTMYANEASGTDSIDKGTGTGADAFATVQYALDLIPGNYSGNVIIHDAARTVGENLIVSGKYPTGNQTITINGTLSAYETITSCTPVVGTGVQRGTITKASAFNKGVADYTNKLVYMETDAVYRLIDGHASTISYTSGGTATSIAVGDILKGNTSGAWGDVLSITLTGGTWAGGNAAGVITMLVTSGTWQNGETVTNYTTSNANHCTTASTAANSTDTIVVVGTLPSTTSQSITISDWGTIAQSLTYNCDVSINYLSITGASTSVVGTKYAVLTAVGCYLHNSASGSISLNTAKISATTCYVLGYLSATTINIINGSIGLFYQSKIKTGGTLMNINLVASFAVSNGSVLEGGSVYGVRVQTNAGGGIYAAAASGYVRIRNCDKGLYAEKGGQIGNISLGVYSGNTTNTGADATTFGAVTA
jgi:hypothetical protein